MSRTSAKLCHRTPSTIATQALISYAASGYSCMASLRCLRVTMCTAQCYFTICEVVKRDRGPQIEAAREEIRAAKIKSKSGARGVILESQHVAIETHGGGGWGNSEALRDR